MNADAELLKKIFIKEKQTFKMSAVLDFSADFRQDPRVRNGTIHKVESHKQSVSSDIDKENIIENSNSKIFNKSILINTYVQRFGKFLDLENLSSPVIGKFLFFFFINSLCCLCKLWSFIIKNSWSNFARKMTRFTLNRKVS